MSLYVRLINKDNWMQGKKKTELNGEAITIDWNCKDNEWSVFKCDDSAVNLKKNEKLNKIVLRMVADNPSKTKKGINLLVLDKDFIDKINTTIIEDPELLGCKHCNIKNINYDKIDKAVSFTFKKRNTNFISYTLTEIRNLFLSFTQEHKQKYKDYIIARTRSDNNIRLINNCFLKTLPDFFNT